MLASEDYRLLFESAPGLYLVLSPRLDIVAATDAYLTATRTCREKILGRHVFDVFPDNPAGTSVPNIRNLRHSLENVLRSKRPDAMAIQKYDIRPPAARGNAPEERHWSPLNVPVLGVDGEVRFILHRLEDATELACLKQQESAVARFDDELKARSERMDAEIFERAQQLQEANQHLFEQLAHSQKMEAVGQLAGGIAHDFNNLLTLIVGYSDLLVEDLAPDSPMRAQLELIQRTAKRAGELTQQILVFSRRHPVNLRPTDLNRVVKDSDHMMRRILGERVELVTQLDASLRVALADGARIQQVLMNLVINARDAMPDGGSVTITTGNQDLDETVGPDGKSIPAGRFAMLTVSDTGCGMTKEVVNRIFEPFFTTKSPGRGTGLGLSMAHGIVEQCHGTIRVYSEPGIGTTFKIYLPVTRGEAEVEAETPAPVAIGGTEMILFVEDDSEIRALTRRMLEQAGYSVLECANAGEALLFVEQAHASPRLLLTDVVMPRMSGLQLARRLRARTPELKVIFISGFTEHPTLEDVGFVERSELLHKPFSRAQLLARVRAVLDAP